MTGKITLSQSIISRLVPPGIPTEEVKVQVLEDFKALGFWAMMEGYIEVRTFFRQNRDEGKLSWLESLEKDLLGILSSLKTPPEDLRQWQIWEKILLLEHPEISGGLDKDIAAYYERRTKGERDFARDIYGRLCGKYPDAELRVTLFRFWRTGSGLFTPLFLEARKRLASTLEHRIRTNLQGIIRSFTASDSPLELLNSLKSVVKFLPAYRPKALQTLGRLTEYADLLGEQPQRFRSVAALVADYLGGSLFQKKEIVLVAPAGMGDEDFSAKPRLQTIDIHQVEFTQEDLARILISPKIQGPENQTLAYCRLYWEYTQDGDLENKILLYSQKNKTHHLSIFHTIRKGQSEGLKDEMILHRVYNLLARSIRYDYNIRKDIYMQRVWAQIKPGSAVVDWSGVDKKAYAAEQARLAMTRREEKKQKARAESEKQMAREKALRAQADALVAKKQQAEQQKKALAEAKTAQALAQQKARRQAAEARLERRAVSLAPAVQATNPFREPKGASEALPGKAEKREARPQSKSTGSGWSSWSAEPLEPTTLRARLEQMDSTEHKNLHLVFRGKIEKVVEEFVRDWAHQEGVTLSNYTLSLAVLAVKDWILRTMDTPQADWTLSKERQEVRELGLGINDVRPAIETCLKELEKSLAPLPN